MIENEHVNDGYLTYEQRITMLEKHHKQHLWVFWTIILLGIWLMVSPWSFGYGNHIVTPAGGRNVWISLPMSIYILKLSDFVSGLLLIVLGFRSLKPNRPIAIWLACFVGIWLNFAPLIFWAPTSVNYLNDTLVGVLVIAMTILIPGMPNMIMYMKIGPDQPPGWSYNPSSWTQRSIMIGLSFAGWLVARYLAMYQMGYIDQAWDPFFGEGTRKVLTSDISRSLPVSDGGLGAFAYTFEFLMSWMGGEARWRTMPWMVLFFGILVIPLGLVHISLVISQPVVVGSWCFMCLLAAMIVLPMIPLEVDEVIAMGQLLREAKRNRKSLWQVFWKGDLMTGTSPDKRTPPISQFADHPLQVFKASLWGMTFPWTLIIAAILGIWQMAVPGLLGQKGMVSNIDHLAGALVVAMSVLAMSEAIRTIRFLNILLALLIIVSPWIFAGSTTHGTINNLIVGVVIIVLSISRGKISESYGAWNKLIY